MKQELSLLICQVKKDINIYSVMERIIFFTMLFFCAFSFSQTRQERLIDSVLVANTGKTYKEYLAHFQKAEKEYEIEKNRILRSWNQRKDKNHTLPPTIPNIGYHNKEYPLVGIISENSDIRMPLYKILKNEFSFDKIKRVDIIPTSYGEKTKVFFIIVE